MPQLVNTPQKQLQYQKTQNILYKYFEKNVKNK